MNKIDRTVLDDFRSTLHENGYSEAEFTANPTDLTKDDPNDIVVDEGIVTVKCISTQKEKTYSSGNCTHWVIDFEKNLKEGFFD